MLILPEIDVFAAAVPVRSLAAAAIVLVTTAFNSTSRSLIRNWALDSLIDILTNDVDDDV